MQKKSNVHKVPNYTPPNRAAIRAGAWKKYRKPKRSAAQKEHIAEYYRQRRLGLELRNRFAE